jgi:hypothetical protein
MGFKFDDLVKSHQKDGCVKSSRCEARKASRVRILGWYAVATKVKRNPAPERDRWTFYEAIKFENLEVWEKALNLGLHIHDLTGSFPKEERLNIAEGSTGQTNAGFKVFLGYAVRSAIEEVSCLYIGKKGNNKGRGFPMN